MSVSRRRLLGWLLGIPLAVTLPARPMRGIPIPLRLGSGNRLSGGLISFNISVFDAESFTKYFERNAAGLARLLGEAGESG